jgi:hypothetical protein
MLLRIDVGIILCAPVEIHIEFQLLLVRYYSYAFQAESTRLPLLPKLYFGKTTLELHLATRAIALLCYRDRKGGRLLPQTLHLSAL